MTHEESTSELAQVSTGTPEQPEPSCISGLAAHLSWALHLDEKQARKAAEIATQWRDGDGEYAFARCESPAECLFILGGVLSGVDFETRDSANPEPEFYGPEMGPRWDNLTQIATCSGMVLSSQVQFGRSRVDFLLESLGAPERPFTSIAIEIDGHEFHERTKEQAASDRERDIHMLEPGIPVIRFTGSQVYADPVRCFQTAVRVLEGFEMMWSSQFELQQAAYQKGLEKGREVAADSLDSTAKAAE